MNNEGTAIPEEWTDEQRQVAFDKYRAEGYSFWESIQRAAFEELEDGMDKRFLKTVETIIEKGSE